MLQDESENEGGELEGFGNDILSQLDDLLAELGDGEEGEEE